MRAVCRRRTDDPGVGIQEAINLGDSIGHAIEEDDVISRDPRPAPCVDMGGKGFAHFHEALGGTIPPGALHLDDVMDYLANPTIDRLAFRDGVADILPDYLHSMLPHHIRELHDLAD